MQELTIFPVQGLWIWLLFAVCWCPVNCCTLVVVCALLRSWKSAVMLRIWLLNLLFTFQWERMQQHVLTIHKHQECEIFLDWIDLPEKYQGLFCQLYIILRWWKLARGVGQKLVSNRITQRNWNNRTDRTAVEENRKRLKFVKNVHSVQKNFVFVRKL